MEWQPISTAPKNPSGEFYGPTILVYDEASELPWPAYWGPSADGDGAWMVIEQRMAGFLHATHWMPIPTPPPETEDAA